MVEFMLQGDHIPLIQLLKATSLVQTGGQAQQAVSMGLVNYNGKTDYRKRLKVKRGDVVKFGKQTICIK